MFIQDPSFWVLVAFIAFIGLVWWKYRFMIISQLDVRVKQIKSELEEAQQLKEAAQIALAEQRRKTRQASDNAEALLTAAKTEVDFLLKQSENKLKTIIHQRQQQALQRLEQAESLAISEVIEHTVDLTIQTSQKILCDQMNGKISDTVIENAIKNLKNIAKQIQHT